MLPRLIRAGGAVFAAVLLCAQMNACGGGGTPTKTNLLTNPSFEEVTGGVPTGWTIGNFRGLADMKAAAYGVDDTTAAEGSRSFYFDADADTKRFYLLTQEVEVHDVDRVRIGGKVRTVGLRRGGDQYPQANFALTFYDENRNRFRSARFADAKTLTAASDTQGWVENSRFVSLPHGTRYIAVHCVLGMEGRMWFDDVVLEVPEGLEWQSIEGHYFTHYWIEGRPYPEGSLEFQEELYDRYATMLGIDEDSRPRIEYYFYPDSASIHKDLGTDELLKADYGSASIRSIHPANDHEIIHILTEQYGQLPRALGEGTAYYLMGTFNGREIQPLAQELLLSKQLPHLRQIIDAASLGNTHPDLVIPAAASFVGYLLEYGGAERFLELHRQMPATHTYDSFQKAFERAYGGSLQEAEKVWREVLRSADFSASATEPAPDGQTPQQQQQAPQEPAPVKPSP